MVDVQAIIRKAALENAIKFDGKANPKALIGAVIQAYPDAKKDMKTTTGQIASIVEEVNALSPDAQEKELLTLNPDYFKEQTAAKQQRKEERQELPELKNAFPGKVVTRMPPEPSKYNHLGHAMSFLINYLYAKKYSGKCILRFDDTNPEKESQEFVDAMEEDVIQYLDIQPDQVVFASDYMPRFYQGAADIIKEGKAYTCSCPSEEISKDRREMKNCPCREKAVTLVEKDWVAMVTGNVKEGALSLRLKIDMQHKNAVMRDPVIMRICETRHYRQGDEYKVWPMYDFENALMDGWLGMTHVLRSNEFDTRIELHDFIKGLFGLPKCEFIHYGRYNVTGMTTQGREIREKIDSGEMIGWDDPRLLTLRALKRRGIVKESYYQLVKQIGLSKTQTNLDFGVIGAINRQILDEEASRYFFVEEPAPISVADWPAKLTSVELKLHPHKHRGGRPLKLDGEFIISKKDYGQITDGKVVRLIDTANIYYDKKKKSFVFHSQSIEDFKKLKKDEKHGLIHFLPVHEKNVKARVFLPNATYADGLCEPTVIQLKEGAHVQLERECFARLDAIENGMYTFWFAHE